MVEEHGLSNGLLRLLRTCYRSDNRTRVLFWMENELVKLSSCEEMIEVIMHGALLAGNARPFPASDSHLNRPTGQSARLAGTARPLQSRLATRRRCYVRTPLCGEVLLLHASWAVLNPHSVILPV
jgi:hypothetical protein